MHHRILIFATALAALPLGGCYVVARPAAPAPIEAYEPAYYDDNVVYYDGGGTPFIYVAGEVRYVPPSYVHYDGLLGHYRASPRAYHDWYGREGYRHTSARRERDRVDDRERERAHAGRERR